ncbi:17013_t:CDS:1, partial [Racocetra persica]
KKSRRGRKAFIIPEKTDTTGQCHFMIVRRVPEVVKNKKKNSCRNCDISDEYVNVLSERINKLEHLINNLEKNVKDLEKRQLSINDINDTEFSRMDTDSLIKFSERFVQSTHCNQNQNEAFINQNIVPQYFDPLPFDTRSLTFYQN